LIVTLENNILILCIIAGGVCYSREAEGHGNNNKYKNF
jgi:hypothetical protein